MRENSELIAEIRKVVLLEFGVDEHDFWLSDRRGKRISLARMWGCYLAIRLVKASPAWIGKELCDIERMSVKYGANKIGVLLESSDSAKQTLLRLLPMIASNEVIS